jgi:hypothetical protein
MWYYERQVRREVLVKDAAFDTVKMCDLRAFQKRVDILCEKVSG